MQPLTWVLKHVAQTIHGSGFRLPPAIPDRGRLFRNDEIFNVIPAWMQESSHKDVKLWSGIVLKSRLTSIGRLPSMALVTGIHAGMTVLAEVPC